MELDTIFNNKHFNIIHNRKEGIIINSDALEFFKTFNDDVADIIFLDPPFNLSKQYEGDIHKDNLPIIDYEEFINELISECSRVLKPGGALFLYHIPKWASIFTVQLNKKLEFRHWISIMMKNGFPIKGYLYPAHYALLYYTKGKPLNFHRPKIELERCRHCDGLIKDYGGYKKYITEGVNLSDVWTDLSPVRHKKYKNRKANELPIKLIDRVISIAGVDSGLIIDPFAGTGTTGIGAIKGNMNYILNDRSDLYCQLMNDRIAEMYNEQK